MLQHHQETAADSHRNLPGKSEPLTNPHIESYLDRVCAPFDARFDAVEAGKLRDEMRSHIESLVQAHIELGETSENAVNYAISNFGTNRSIAREWNRTLARQQANTRKQGMRVSFAIVFSTYAIVIVATVLLDRYVSHGIEPYSRLVEKTIPALQLPALGGLLAGIIVGRRSVAAMWDALIRFIPAISLFNNIWCSFNHVIEPGVSPAGDFLYFFSLQVLAFSFLWIPIACASAGIGSFIRWLMQRPSRYSTAG